MKIFLLLALFLCFSLPIKAQKNNLAKDSLKLQLLTFKNLDTEETTLLPKYLHQIVFKNQEKILNFDANFKNLNYNYLKQQNILEAYAERYYLLESLYPNSKYYLREKPGNFKLIGIPATPPIRKNY